MAITATSYGPFGLHLLKGDIDIDSATIKVTLHTSSYTPDADHEYFSEVTNEVTGTGYTAGGESIGSVATAYDSTNNWAAISGSDVTWSSASLTYRYAVVRIDTGTDSTSPLIFWIDFGVDQTATATDISLQWDTSGFLLLSSTS